MLKKIVALAIALSMLSTLVACTGSNKNESKTLTKEEESNSKAETATDPIEIEYWVGWTPGSSTETNALEMIKKYEEENNVKVNVSVISYDMMHTKLIAAGAAGNTPDISWGLPEWLAEFNNMGLLENLTEHFNNWNEKDQIYENVMDALTMQEKIKALPLEVPVRALLVHTNDLQEAGVEVPKTWDDLLALTDYKDKTRKYPFEFTGAGVRSPQELLVYLAQNDLKLCSEQKDGKFKNTWNENADELERATEVFEFYKDLVEKSIVNEDAKVWGWEETDENFAIDFSSMHVSGNWMQSKEESNPEEMKDVAVYPIPYKNTPATYMEAKANFIYAGHEDKMDEIFKFATFVCGKEFQEAVFSNRSPRKDVMDESKWGKDFSALADTGIVFPPVTLGGITQNMMDALAMVLQEDVAPKEAAQWLGEAINTSLKENGEYGE